MLCLDCVRMIENNGFNAFPIAASQSRNTDKEQYAGVFPHKTGAVLSGLGYIGKNALLITDEYGSRIRLATVLTDMPLMPEREMLENGCGDCHICVDACPAKAISGRNYTYGEPRESIFDPKRCSDNMKTYKDIGRGAVCGICIAVCPKNQRSTIKH